MEINKTLLMGKTNFEMRGNLANKEPKMLETWETEDLYHQVLAKRNKDLTFMLHDGPPYANGDMHCGHMLNRILKDIVLRFKAMDGYYTPFYPGWDTHGLPIENAVSKSGVDRKKVSPVEFRKKCEEYAHKQVNRQMQQVKRLGLFADFDNKYVTLDKNFEKSQIHVFKEMALKGYIFKGLKPVYWSYSSESALAEAEIEYYDVKADTIYVKFQVRDGLNKLDNDTYFVIWTTTPWTIPANLAICLNPDLTYGLFETDKGKLVFLESLKDTLKEELNLHEIKLIKTFKGKELEYIKTKHPLYDRDSLIILGNHVTSDAGTGCVHTAPGHGEDDYNVSKLYNIPPYCPVDEHGRMDSSVGKELSGMFYEDANKEVLKMLDNVGALLSVKEIVHSYPHDWRTKKPVIFRATPQWFCSIDKIRDQLLKEIDKVNWIPSWGNIRMHNMIKDRGDWCISRQRAWGVPLPIIYDKDGNALLEKEILDNIENLIGEYGSNIWFEKTAEELLPQNYVLQHKEKAPFRKETDIMDVWFDSGSSSKAVMIDRHEKFPADLYLEGCDQYRGWFNSSLIVSVATEGVAPYKAVLSHGFVLDGNGNKMSKSLGNGIDPNKIINVYGADVLRLYVATVDYQADVRISEAIIKTVSETYRKIRNVFKFMLANLDNNGKLFDPNKDLVKDYSRVSKYILMRLDEVTNIALDEYNKYNFANMIQEILTFLTQDISAFYLSLAKDYLYCDEVNSSSRKEYQSVIYLVATTLSKLLAPVLCFTMEEVHQYLPSPKEKYMILEDMVKGNRIIDKALLEEYKLFMSMRSEVLKALENARANSLIGSSLEADITLEALNSDVEKLLKQFTIDELNHIFIVSRVNFAPSENKFNYVGVTVKKHQGKKCERCWQYFDELITFENYHVCPRCFKVIKNYE